MVTTKLNLSMTEPQVRQIYAKQGDTGRVLDITLDQTPEDGTLRILRPDGTEVTSEAVTGGEVSESGETVTFESMTEADVTELKANIEPIQFSLPSGYQAVEYIQSTGHEYINTGFVPTSDDGFEIDFISNNDFSGSGNYGCILGARSSSMTLDFQLTTWSAGTNGTLRWGTGFQHGGGFLDKGTRQKAKLYQKTYTAPDGSTYSFTSDYTGAYSLYVFSLNNAGGAAQNGSVILYSLKLYRSADLAMYLVPCKRTSDNKLGLYDVVGGTFLPVVNIDSSANPQGGGNVSLPNPTNPLPITGHDEVAVIRTGKNLCPTFKSGTRSGLTYTVNEDGSVHVTGTCTGTMFWALPFSLPKGTYVLSGAPSGGQLTIRNGDGGSAPSSAFSGTLDDYGNGATFTVSETASAWLNIRSTAGTHDKMYYPMIRLASETDATYEPYRSNTYTTSLGQTVYGGTLDLVSGVLTVDSRYLTVSDFTFMSSGTSAGGLYWVNVPQTYPAGVNDNSDTNVCSHAPYTSSGDVGWGSRTPIFNVNTGGFPARMYVASESLADFQTEYATLQAVYKLAEPVEYQLTPQQIKTLVGTNNVWASSGDIVNITFTYGGLLSELPSGATEIVGKCYCDVEQNGASSMPFTLNVKKNERES